MRTVRKKPNRRLPSAKDEGPKQPPGTSEEEAKDRAPQDDAAMGPRPPAQAPQDSVKDPSSRQRRTRQRPKTIAGKRLSKAEIKEGIGLLDDLWYERPKTRADCVDGIRPCPFVSCRYHLYLEVNEKTNSIKLNFPHLEVWEMEHTCALDVADQGGLTLEEVGHILNLTRERVRQVEMSGIDGMKETGLIDDIERIFGEDLKFYDL